MSSSITGFKKAIIRIHLYFKGDYQLHLQTAQAMHPFFPAAGHNNYAKSIQIYLQDMENLSRSNPCVHEFFSDGNFVTRRSNRYWSGLPDDLIIEQVKWKFKFIYSAAIRVKPRSVTYRSFHCTIKTVVNFFSNSNLELNARKLNFFYFFIFSDCKEKRWQKGQSCHTSQYYRK